MHCRSTAGAKCLSGARPPSFHRFFSGAGPYLPKGFALTGGTATDVAGAAGGVVGVAVCPRSCCRPPG